MKEKKTLTRLDTRLKKAKALMRKPTAKSRVAAKVRPTRVLSPAGRAKIAAAQKARWAKVRKAKAR
jgi:hypothetical protein